MMKNVNWYVCKLPFILVRFNRKFDFLYKFSQKYPNDHHQENPSSRSRVFPCGQAETNTDRHEKANIGSS